MLRMVAEFFFEAIAVIALALQRLAFHLLPRRRPLLREFRAWDGANNEFILIYVGYSEKLDCFSKSYLNGFKRRGAYVIFVTNFPQFDFQSIDSSLVDVYIDNRGQGWDFAQYKTASEYVMERFGGGVPRKVVYANDSVFYVDRGGDEHVAKLLDERFDFIGAFELSGRGGNSPWHLSSWLFSVSSGLFLSEQLQRFWSDHVPLKNKRYAIRNGEHKLTATALSYSDRVQAIYNNDYLISCLLDSVARNGAARAFGLISSVFRNAYEGKFNGPTDSEDYLSFVRRNLYAFSPIHMFAILLIADFEFPFIKKDLFWFNNQTYDALGSLEEIVREVAGKDAASELLRYFLRRGRVTEATLRRRLMMRIGLA